MALCFISIISDLLIKNSQERIKCEEMWRNKRVNNEKISSRDENGSFPNFM